MADLMRSGNPALNDKVFRGVPGALGETMTLEGTVNKTGILLLCAVATAAWTWHLAMNPDTLPLDYMLLLVGLFGGLIFALITSFKKTWAPVTAPIYALLEGLVLGGLSATLEQRYPGIAIESVCLTFGTMFVLLLAYRSGMIKVTQKFRLGVIAATGAIFLFYMVELLLGFFGIQVRVGEWVGHAGYRDQPGDCVRGGAESGARFRFHREWCDGGRSEVYGVVRRIWADGHAGVAVPGDAAADGEAAGEKVAGSL